MGGRLEGKVGIVTGAGSRVPGLGNGKATAILFAREGARVLCVDLMKERAEETVEMIIAERREAGAPAADRGDAVAFAADVARAADCEAMVEQAVRRWGT